MMNKFELYDTVNKDDVVILYTMDNTTVFLDTTDGRTYEFDETTGEVDLRPCWKN